MVKAYLRYEQSSAFGVIASGAIEFDESGKLIYSACLDSIGIFNIKQGSMERSLQPSMASTSSASSSLSESTVIARAPHAPLLAVGYSDGSVRLWDLVSSECTVTLKGHKSSVTALRFNKNGYILASGSKDTDLIVWDVVAETGLYRLRGHRDQVTDLAFLDRCNRLVSSSKDGFVKCWNLGTQHCEQTLSGHKAEVWSLDVDPLEQRLVTGSTDHEIRVYSINVPEEEGEEEAGVGVGVESKKRKKVTECLQPMGSIKRQSGDRVSRLRYDEVGGFLACQGAGKSIELFRVRGEAEAKKKLKRRKKRRKEKLSKKEDSSSAQDIVLTDEDSDELRATDELESLQVITCKSKIKSFAFSPQSAVLSASKLLSSSSVQEGGAAVKKECLTRLALSLSNNSLEIIDVIAPCGSLVSEQGLQPSDLSLDISRRIDQGGHRSDIRSLALSWDDQLLASSSNSCLKVWRPHTGACLSSMDSGYGLSVLFVPGNNHVVLGCKEGTIEVFDVGSSARVHVEEAHTGPVWSLCMLPDKTGFVSGSADKEVKFWQWQVIVSKEDGTKQLRLKHVRTLKMAEDVLCVKISPDARLIAVSLLDATVKVFYLDSLKFFLSLYGHKLPVLCMDISSDSTLLVTGSADKNIKIWGLDFGDCHKSLFAHGDTVMQVAFVHNTHYCFTVGKDRMLKYWDLDRNEMLLELSGHHGEVWALAVSAYGDFVVTGSHDKSLRMWEKTQEPFFVEEEREKRLESLFESDLDQQDRRDEEAAGSATRDAGEGIALSAGRRTLDSVGAADSIIEALEMAANEAERQRQEREAAEANVDSETDQPSGTKQRLTKKPTVNPLMLGLTPSAYILRSIAMVKPSDLESALLMLPFNDALSLLSYIPEWIGGKGGPDSSLGGKALKRGQESKGQRRVAAGGHHIELACRAAVLLLRLHHSQLVATSSARHILLNLSKYLRPGIQALKDLAGFNLAALGHLQRTQKDRIGLGGVTADDDYVKAKVALLGGKAKN